MRPAFNRGRHNTRTDPELQADDRETSIYSYFRNRKMYVLVSVQLPHSILAISAHVVYLKKGTLKTFCNEDGFINVLSVVFCYSKKARTCASMIKEPYSIAALVIVLKRIYRQKAAARFITPYKCIMKFIKNRVIHVLRKTSKYCFACAYFSINNVTSAITLRSKSFENAQG